MFPGASSGSFGWARGFTAAIGVAAVLGVSACGGDDDSPSSASSNADGQAIIAIGEQMNAAFKNGDAKAACDLIAPAALKEALGSRAGCEKRVNAAINQGTTNPEISFNEITVDGDTATAVTGSEGGSETTYNFVKVAGDWKIDPTG